MRAHSFARGGRITRTQRFQNLLMLIDDRLHNGADRFDGELILFGSEKWPTWAAVTDYLLNRTSERRPGGHPFERRFVNEMLDRLHSLNNVTRGVFAETVVAANLPGATLQQDGYDAVDMIWNGISIQVKCSGERQAWHTEGSQPSAASWQAPKTRKSTPDGRVSDEPRQRWADVWVLARHDGGDILAGWTFYVVPVTVLDDLLGDQGKAVSTATLTKRGVEPVGLQGLAEAVTAAGVGRPGRVR